MQHYTLKQNRNRIEYEILKYQSTLAPGLEGIRRIVGIAHVKNITSVQDEEKKTIAERLCMLASKSFIMKREELKTGKDFLEVIKQTTAKL